MRTCLLLSLAACGGALLASSCSHGPTDGAPGREERLIELQDPVVPDIGLKPGYSRRLIVRYSSAEGSPVASAPVQFYLVGDPKGSTVSADSVLTDALGLAAVDLRAGSAESSFSVQISAPDAAPKVLYIEVGDVGFGVVSARSVYGGDLPSGVVALVDYLLYNTLTCGAVSPYAPDDADRAATASALGERVRFGSLRVGSGRSLLALGFGAQGQLLAAGCSDLAPDLVRNGTTIELPVVLVDLPPRATGTFALESRFRLETSSGPLAEALAGWRDLVSCPLEPAQTLLDCLVAGADGNTPSGCTVPDPAIGLAARLGQQRGEADPNGCRGAAAAEASESLDRLLQTSLTDGQPALLVALSQVAARAETLLSELRVKTFLTLPPPGRRPASGAIETSASHQLVEIGFGGPVSPNVSFGVGEIATPVPLASPVAVTIEGTTLTIGRHRLGINFGQVARWALADAILEPAGIPARLDELATQLFELVRTPGFAPGCPALSALVCTRLGDPPDCAVAACEAARPRLVAQLEAAYGALASPASDLELAGAAQMVDDSGDLVAERLTGSQHAKSAAWTEAALYLGGAATPSKPISASFSGTAATAD